MIPRQLEVARLAALVSYVRPLDRSRHAGREGHIVEEPRCGQDPSPEARRITLRSRASCAVRRRGPARVRCDMATPPADEAQPLPTDRKTVARDLYHILREQLREEVVGHAAIVDRLALAGAQHAAGIPSRLVLVGPPGVGKTTLVRTLAESLRLPYLLVDLTELAETNFTGLQLADLLANLYIQAECSIGRMEKAVIVLDELDKVAMRGGYTVGRDYRRGKRQSLLALLGGGVPVRFGASGYRDRSMQWRSDSALIIGAGVFQGLAPGRDPAPEDLIRLGLMPELVERLGQVVRLQPLGSAELARVLERRLELMRTAFEAFGYSLTVTPAALATVAHAVAQGHGRAGPRTAATWLIAAAQRGLMSLLNADAAPGTTWSLTPDDVADRLLARPSPRRR